MDNKLIAELNSRADYYTKEVLLIDTQTDKEILGHWCGIEDKLVEVLDGNEFELWNICHFRHKGSRSMRGWILKTSDKLDENTYQLHTFFETYKLKFIGEN